MLPGAMEAIRLAGNNDMPGVVNVWTGQVLHSSLANGMCLHDAADIDSLSVGALIGSMQRSAAVLNRSMSETANLLLIRLVRLGFGWDSGATISRLPMPQFGSRAGSNGAPSLRSYFSPHAHASEGTDQGVSGRESVGFYQVSDATLTDWVRGI